jgi:hypothetical protein
MMHQQTIIQNSQVCEMCNYFVNYVTNKIYDCINYYLCIKQKVDDEIEESYDDDISWINNNNLPGPYDDIGNEQWNHVCYDGYDGYDN